MSYTLVVTNIGLSKIQNANIEGSTLRLEQFAVGDGVIEPSVMSQELGSEKYRDTITAVEVVDGVITFDLVVPETVGGWYIREVGIFDDTGDLFAIANTPVTYKNVPTDGAAKNVHLVLKTSISNSDLISFVNDQSVVYGTQHWVNEQIALEAQARSSAVAALDAAKINSADVVDNLSSTSTSKPVSANQARILKGFIDALNSIVSSDDTTLDELQEIVDYIKANRDSLDALSISNIAGLETALAGCVTKNTDNIIGGRIFFGLPIVENSSASVQVNGFMRIGAILLHDTGGGMDPISQTNTILRNNGGTLEYSGGMKASSFEGSGALLAGVLKSNDLTSSPTDNTVGKVAKIGDHGLGSLLPIAENTDLNTLTNNASYSIGGHATWASLVNRPTDELNLVGILKTSYYTQTCILDNGKIYERFRGNKTGFSWSAWRIANSVGDKQTWQTPVRNGGVVYTNDTQQPIMVIVSIYTPGGGARYGTVTIDGQDLLLLGQQASASAATYATFTASFIVPVGSTYKVVPTTHASIYKWHELR